MGKTDMGVYLADHLGFKHLDFENPAVLTDYLGDGKSEFLRQVEDLKHGGRDVVISWGFVPDVQLEFVLLLPDLDFRWVWFDGNRDLALAEYLGEGRPRAAWDVQLAKIERYVDPLLNSLVPQRVDTFNRAGERRDRSEIAAELLGQ